MHYYSIMRLDLDHIDEYCEDIKAQCESGVSDCALFSMPLVPEGNPPVDKAGLMVEQYKKYKEKLDAMGIRNGILVQCSIGHSYPLGGLFPFTQYENVINGNKEFVCCPYDDDFCEFFKGVMSTLASAKPDVIMIDDDFRLMHRPGGGCGCPLHMAEFNRLAGTDMTREELMEIMKKEEGVNRPYTDIFVETQKQSLLKAARAMREGIDAVDPSTPGLTCGCGDNEEFFDEIAQIFAGKGQPVVVRLNCGNYLTSSGREFTRTFLRTAAQIAKLKGKADVFLDETDTCPQNRYSTSAQVLHAHHVGAVLEGVNGAKHWITRAPYEPDSGKAYRKILSKYHGMYIALADIVPSLKWRGFRIPVLAKPYHAPTEPVWSPERGGWGVNLIERLGLPMYFSAENNGIACYEGPADRVLSDEQITEFLSGTVILASDAAKRLQDRGFGKYLGVEVREWKGLPPSNEKIYSNNNNYPVQKNVMELVPMNDSVVVESMVQHSKDKVNFTPLFPGSTVYKNELGGTVIVFSGTPVSDFNFVQPFSFLCEGRKKQLIKLAVNANELPVYYPDDAEIYLRAADMSDGGLFCSIFNLGLDVLEEIPLITEKEVSSVDMMLPDGTWTSCRFRKENNQIIIETSAQILNPVILILR